MEIALKTIWKPAQPTELELVSAQDFDLIHYIPEQYDGSTAKAEIKNGVLLVTISKREELKPKKLSIKF